MTAAAVQPNHECCSDHPPCRCCARMPVRQMCTRRRCSRSWRTCLQATTAPSWRMARPAQVPKHCSLLYVTEHPSWLCCAASITTDDGRSSQHAYKWQGWCHADLVMSPQVWQVSCSSMPGHADWHLPSAWLQQRSASMLEGSRAGRLSLKQWWPGVRAQARRTR